MRGGWHCGLAARRVSAWIAQILHEVGYPRSGECLFCFVWLFKNISATLGNLVLIILPACTICFILFFVVFWEYAKCEQMYQNVLSQNCRKWPSTLNTHQINLICGISEIFMFFLADFIRMLPVNISFLLMMTSRDLLYNIEHVPPILFWIDLKMVDWTSFQSSKQNLWFLRDLVLMQPDCFIFSQTRQETFF